MKRLKQLVWNGGEHRLRAGVRILFSLLVFFILYRGYLLILNGIGVNLFYSSQTPPWVFPLAGTVRLIPVILVLWLGGRFIDRRWFKDFGFHVNKGWCIDLCFGIGLGALLMSLLFAVQLAFGWVSIVGTVHEANSGSGVIGPLVALLCYFACLGAAEEMLSRGYLIKNLAEGFNLISVGPKRAVAAAWLLTSAVFGLAHLGNPQAGAVGVLNLIMFGLVMGAGFVWTGDLAVPIGMHVAWNFFQGNVFGFPVSGVTFPAGVVSLLRITLGGPELWTGGAFGPEAGLLGLFANALGLALIWIWVKARRRGILRDVLAQYESALLTPHLDQTTESQLL
jgi:membrane protease YdiL (CAAX protease family)